MLATPPDLSGPTSRFSAEALRFLEGVQANIVKSHGRDHAAYLFLQFERSAEQCRRALSEILPDVVTSGSEQVNMTERWHKARAKRSRGSPVYGEPVGMFLLSATGYKRLDLIAHAPEDDPFFHGGIKAEPKEPYGDALWRPDLEQWEGAYRHFRLDAAIVLADDKIDRLLRRANRVKRKVGKIALIIAEEHGRRKLHAGQSGPLREHFGFRDGVASPEQPDEVLVEEPNPGAAPSDPPSYGSFALYLKLEQNALAFQLRMAEFAAKVSSELGRPAEAEEVEGLAVGRHRDGYSLIEKPLGTPLAELRKAASMPDAKLNAFDFGDPDIDLICPAHAHIRKMNQRDHHSEAFARRGLFYGPERDDLRPRYNKLPPSAGVGLLFLSFQESMATPIVMLERSRFGCMDATMGHKSAWRPDGPCSEGDSSQPWSVYGKQFRFQMSDFVNERGGEYFFAPSMNFIRRIGRG